MTSDQRAARRRFLCIAASLGAGTALPTLAVPAAASCHQQRGVLFGADTRIRLYHPDAATAHAAMADCFSEARRLESVFSLYRADSALSRLNRDGHLDHPPQELVALLRTAIGFGAATGGAFDITVQPLWSLFAAHFAAADADPDGPPSAAIERARERVDYRAIDIADRRVAFRRSGMAVTLNGIAQGYITDRLAERLRARGFGNVLVDIGELRALGTHADGSPWRVGIADPQQRWRSLTTLPLRDQALATSGGYGTPFDASGRHHHLFDPRSGRSAGRYRSVSVTAPDATTADALSTALSALAPAAAREVLRKYPLTSALFIDADGARWSAGLPPHAVLV